MTRIFKKCKIGDENEIELQKDYKMVTKNAEKLQSGNEKENLYKRSVKKK